jgi:ribosomal protein S27E
MIGRARRADLVAPIQSRGFVGLERFSERKSWGFTMEFACPDCGSPAVVYPDHITDDAPVKCRRCHAVLCNLREFKRFARDGMARVELVSERWSRNSIASGIPFSDRLFRVLTYFVDRFRTS